MLSCRVLDARANLGLTALHYAAGNGAAEALQLLLNHGARYQMKDLRQRTPHYLAQHNNHA
ncbi:Notch, putative, partial [Acanthamoeba castellanii str. Neff]